MDKKKPRILFYAQDGRGLGHLRRISRIAQALERDASCLVVSGYREAAWLVSDYCEFLHLPSLDLLLRHRAAERNWPRFFTGTDRDAREFRRRLLESAVGIFAPDLIVVDHDPSGRCRELLNVIRTSTAKKLFLMRGIMDNPSRPQADIIDTVGRALLKTFYHAIAVACDPRICDVVSEYALPAELSQKLQYVGYISERMPIAKIDRCRDARGLHNDDIWVVCSAGGGAFGEAFTEECIRVAEKTPHAIFDIVVGPQSRLGFRHEMERGKVAPRVRIHAEVQQLPLWHAAADVVICSGGYNSIIEVLGGQAELICVPKVSDEEQFIHAQRISGVTPIRIVTKLDTIEAELHGALAQFQCPTALPTRNDLDFSGAEAMRNLVFKLLDEPVPRRVKSRPTSSAAAR